MLLVPDPALIWMVGPSGAGKSTWAAERFGPQEIVSSDQLRGVVGSGPNDLDASEDAFAVLELIAAARLRRGQLAVIDSLGFDSDLRRRLASVATSAGLPLVAVPFKTEEKVCRERNRQRPRPVPAKALTAQFTRYRDVVAEIESDGWLVVEPAVAVVEPAHLPGTASAKNRNDVDSTSIEFFLQISTFDWMDKSADRLTAVVSAAEAAGFAGVSVMDHLIQIPQVGRAWDDMLDPYSVLAYVAASTDRLRLGVLVSNVTLRPPAVLAKMLASLDLLSGGRAECGLGAGWFEREQTDRAIDFPADRQRLDLLEDTVLAMRAFWGPGGKPFEGKQLQIKDTSCYPRPIQGDIPIIVGGAGERRTLRIAAAHADGVNLSSEFSTLERKLGVLRSHCADVGRDFDDLLVTVLDVTLVGVDRKETAELVEQHRGNTPAVRYRSQASAGTVDDQIGRYRRLAELGVQRVYLSLLDLDGPDPVDRFAPVTDAFR